jgi:hypothetical protein
LLSLSRSPAVGPWGIPDELAPDDAEEEYRLGADADEDDAAGAGVAGALDAELVEAVELELEPQPAITSAPSMRAPVTSRRTDLPGVAISMCNPSGSGR